jgi:hypothetical protein
MSLPGFASTPYGSMPNLIMPTFVSDGLPLDNFKGSGAYSIRAF